MTRHRGSSLVSVSNGDGLPVFVPHTRSGHAWAMCPLIKRLSLQRPVYAFQALDLGWRSDVQALDEMVLRYVTDIRACQPRGPYSLVGYSFGGVLAFEIANRLILDGENVRHLVMLDTFGPQPKWQRRSRAARRVAASFLLRHGGLSASVTDRFGLLRGVPACMGWGPLTSAELRLILAAVRDTSDVMEQSAGMNFEQLCAAIATEVKQRVTDAEWQRQVRSAQSHDPIAILQSMKIYAKNGWLNVFYRPRCVFPGRITIYAHPLNDAIGRWRPFAGNGLDLRLIETRSVNGHPIHMSFVAPPNLDLYADDLKSMLEES